MVAISAGTLISDCCNAVAVCADDECITYQCSACAKPCTASESLSEYHERLEAPKRERQRLTNAVIDAAKAYRTAVLEHMEYVSECMARDPSHDEDEDPKWDAQLGAQCSTEHALSEAVDALTEFEAENKVTPDRP